MDELFLSPGGYPSPGFQWEANVPPPQRRIPQWEANVPQVLDKVSMSLMSFLPKMEQDGQHGQEQMPMTWAKLQPPSVPGRCRAPSPSTPKKSAGQQARDVSRSPPPAPKQTKVQLGQALANNDLVQVVEILAKHPQAATMPFLDDGNYELPLARATRLHCDEMILEILKENGAEFASAENRPMNQMANPYLFPLW